MIAKRTQEMLLRLLLLVAAIALYAVAVEYGYIKDPDAPDPDELRFTPPPPVPPPMPAIVTTRSATPEACARLLDAGGRCADETHLERCIDGGIETVSCLWTGRMCERDRCAPGAACCGPLNPSSE